MTHTLLGVKIPLTFPALIALVVSVLLAALFLWWWFGKRKNNQARITTLVSGAPPAQEGELQEINGIIHFIYRNQLHQHEVKNIREIRIRESVSPQVNQFQIEIVMHQPPHLVMEAGFYTHQAFVNRILVLLDQTPINWGAPLPVLHRIGNMTVKGYKVTL